MTSNQQNGEPRKGDRLSGVIDQTNNPSPQLNQVIRGDDLIAAEWPVTRRETARVTLRRYKDRWLVDLRRWFRGDDGELRPSNKGISLAVEHLPQLADAIAFAMEEAHRRGFIGVKCSGTK